jgi:L-fuculose-phosphate aldolase
MLHKEKYKQERKEVAAFMRRLYKQGLTTTSGGNISMKLSHDLVLITPSGTDKGRMNWKEVGIMTVDGKNLTPSLKPSMETGMHLSIYRKRKDVNAVIHAHPVFSSSFTAMHCSIDTNLTAEAAAILGEPLLVPYALMGSTELAANVSESSILSVVLLLENHGILTIGSSLLQAFDRLEVLENAAKMTVITELMKQKKPLEGERLNQVRNFFK